MQPANDDLKTFQDRLDLYSQLIYNYNKPDWQASARSTIPIETLTERAKKNLPPEQHDPSSPLFRDELLKQLLAWFKYEFFNWVNQPECQLCKGPTKRLENTTPDETEASFGAKRVELYDCEPCKQPTRFPRYNNAQKLLETKRGRCGEWAQVFTLCARTLGYEVRIVYDWTDHVWNEVYSEAQGRWLHCDSCENSCDSPLLYEAGWGKKLTYLVAFSIEEVLDVTPKYTKTYKEVLTRRTLVPEDWLADYVKKLNEERFKSLDDIRKELLNKRKEVEAGEFKKNLESEKQVEESEKEQHGRISGSVEWRAERGELGDMEKTLLAEKKEEEIKNSLDK